MQSLSLSLSIYLSILPPSSLPLPLPLPQIHLAHSPTLTNMQSLTAFSLPPRTRAPLCLLDFGRLHQARLITYRRSSPTSASSPTGVHHLPAFKDVQSRKRLLDFGRLHQAFQARLKSRPADRSSGPCRFRGGGYKESAWMFWRGSLEDNLGLLLAAVEHQLVQATSIS